MSLNVVSGFVERDRDDSETGPLSEQQDGQRDSQTPHSSLFGSLNDTGGRSDTRSKSDVRRLEALLTPEGDDDDNRHVYGVSPKIASFSPPVSTSQSTVGQGPALRHLFHTMDPIMPDSELEAAPSSRADSVMLRDAPSSLSGVDDTAHSTAHRSSANVFGHGLAEVSQSSPAEYTGTFAANTADLSFSMSAHSFESEISSPHFVRTHASRFPSHRSLPYERSNFLSRLTGSFEGLRVAAPESPVDDAITPGGRRSLRVGMSPDVDASTSENTVRNMGSHIVGASNMLQASYVGMGGKHVHRTSTRVPVKAIRINLPQIPGSPPNSPMLAKHSFHTRRSSSVNSLGSVANLISTPQHHAQTAGGAAQMPNISLGGTMATLAPLSQMPGSLGLLSHTANKLHAMLSTPQSMGALSRTTPISPLGGSSTIGSPHDANTLLIPPSTTGIGSTPTGVLGIRSGSAEEEAPTETRPTAPPPAAIMQSPGAGRSPGSTPAELYVHIPIVQDVTAIRAVPVNSITVTTEISDNAVPSPERQERAWTRLITTREHSAWRINTDTSNSLPASAPVSTVTATSATISTVSQPNPAMLNRPASKSYGIPSPIHFSQAAPVTARITQPAAVPAGISVAETTMQQAVSAITLAMPSPPGPHPRQLQHNSNSNGSPVRKGSDSSVNAAHNADDVLFHPPPQQAIIARAKSSAFTGTRLMPPPVPATTMRQVSAPSVVEHMTGEFPGSRQSAFVPRSASAFKGRRSPLSADALVS